MTNTLPIKAKVMIGMVAVASLCALSFGVVRWQSQAWPQLVLLLAAAALSSRLKVKLPGMTSSMSGNLPVILLDIEIIDAAHPLKTAGLTRQTQFLRELPQILGCGEE